MFGLIKQRTDFFVISRLITIFIDGAWNAFRIRVINDEVRTAIMNNSDSSTIKARAREHGMKTLREDGALKVIAGLTTVAEVTRVTREDEVSLDTLSAA